jgi:sporulation protein YlmC with PRC-barrel domain
MKLGGNRCLSAVALAVFLTGLTAAHAQDDANRPDRFPGAHPAPGGDRDGSADPTRSSLRTYDEYLAGSVARVSELLGQRVLSIGGNDVGEIEEVLLSSGVAGPTVVVSVGGLLHAGDKLVTAPLSDLKVSSEKELYIDRTESQLEADPTFAYDRAGTGPAAPRPIMDTAGRRVAGRLLGAAVTDYTGKKVGEIDDIVISAAGGERNRAVLSVGGGRRGSEKLVAVPLDELTITQTATEPDGSLGDPQVRLEVTLDEVKKSPEFHYEVGPHTTPL